MKTLKIKKQSRAFTLIELLVVVAIMAIMTAVIIPRDNFSDDEYRDRLMLNAYQSSVQYFTCNNFSYLQIASGMQVDRDSDSLKKYDIPKCLTDDEILALQGGGLGRVPSTSLELSAAFKIYNKQNPQLVTTLDSGNIFALNKTTGKMEIVELQTVISNDNYVYIID